jgi:hypothetical protein
MDVISVSWGHGCTTDQPVLAGDQMSLAFSTAPAATHKPHAPAGKMSHSACRCADRHRRPAGPACHFAQRGPSSRQDAHAGLPTIPPGPHSRQHRHRYPLRPVPHFYVGPQRAQQPRRGASAAADGSHTWICRRTHACWRRGRSGQPAARGGMQRGPCFGSSAHQAGAGPAPSDAGGWPGAVARDCWISMPCTVAVLAQPRGAFIPFPRHALRGFKGQG